MEILGDARSGDAADQTTHKIPIAERWVAKSGNTLPRTRHGLLQEDALNAERHTDQRLRRATDLIGSGSYVLLAPAQSGKTTLFRDLCAVESGSTLVDLRLFTREPIATAVRERAQGRSVVYLDALDEALRADPNAGYALATELREPWARSVSWRIACRPSSWDPDIVRGLDVEEVELLPLHEGAVRAMAGTDADSFISAIASHSLTRLLPSAGQARRLLGRWQKSGSLPASGVESLDHAVTSLLVEQRVLGTRTQQQTVEQMRGVAEHLAALSVFCGKEHFIVSGLGNQIGDSVIGAMEVPAPSKTSGHGATALDAEHVREVLDTALFVSAGSGTLTFTHQSYADYLAASYLRRCNVVGQRLASLLGATTNGLVAPGLQEVVGWLLAIGARVPGEITEQNAKELLRAGGMELTSHTARLTLVEAVLRLAADQTIDEGWGVDTSHLVHPRLADQLRSGLARAENHWSVFWVCRIARQCAVTGITAELLSVTSDSRWPDFVRTEAIRALGAVPSQIGVASLTPLLNLPTDEDPRDEILGAALRELILLGLPAAQFADALRPPRARHYIGGYEMFLAELDKFVQPADALTVLDAILPKRTHQDHRLDDAAIRLMTLVWARRDRNDAAALGRLLGSDLKARSFAQRRRSLPWETDPNVDLRRTMGFAALDAGERADLVVSRLQLLVPEDVGWLLDQLEEVGNPVGTGTAALLQGLAWLVPRADLADRILNLPDTHPAYLALESTRGACQLDEKPEWYEPKTTPAERERRQQHLANLRERLAATRDQPELWWHVVDLLADSEESTDEVFLWDLTRRTYWEALTTSEQEEAVELGLFYLTQREPTTEQWATSESWSTSTVMPDWSAVFLLATLAVHWPQHTEPITSETWTQWAPALVAVPRFAQPATSAAGEACWQLHLSDVGGDHLRRALVDALCDRIMRGRATDFEGHPLLDLSNTELANAVVWVAQNQDQPMERRDAAHRVLAAQVKEVALEIAIEAFGAEDHCSLEAIKTIGRYAPTRVVRRWIDSGALGPSDHIGMLDPNLLSNQELVWLANALLDAFPYAADPESRGGGASAAENARHCRNRCLQLMVERGLAVELESMLEGRDEFGKAQIRHFLYQARIEQARSSWRPLAPDELVSLVAAGDARLIRDPAHLLGVLRELLDEFQHELHQRGAYRDVWDGDPVAKNTNSSRKQDSEPRPKGEDAVSDRVQRFLGSRLETVAVDRELQVVRTSERGVGTRIDLTLTAPGDARPSRVLIEAKHVHNPEIPIAINAQLADRYLNALKLTHGLYLVYWTAAQYRASGSKSKYASRDELEVQLQEQADRLKPNLCIDVYVLDIGPAA